MEEGKGRGREREGKEGDQRKREYVNKGLF